MADRYVQARGDKLNWKDEAAGVRRQSKVTCFKCGEEGHGVAQCRNGPEALQRAEDKYGQPKDERHAATKQESDVVSVTVWATWPEIAPITLHSLLALGVHVRNWNQEGRRWQCYGTE